MGRIKEILKKYPVLLGIAGALAVMGIMGVYQFWHSHFAKESTLNTEEAQRDQTIEKIDNPEEIVEYLFSALKQEDLDKALRAYPIDEVCLSYSLQEDIALNGAFYTDLAIMPSSLYRTYFGVSSVELTGKFAEQIQILQTFFDKDTVVKSIDFAYPETQMTNDYILQMQEEAKIWGASGICEMSALLEKGEKCYIVGITLSRYSDYWKILSLTSTLVRTDINNMLHSINAEEYEEVKGNVKKSTFLKYASKWFDDTDDEDGKNGKKKEIEKGLLAPNYFILKANGENKPEKVIKNFVLDIQKNDLNSAMSYCMTIEDEKKLEHTSYEVLQKQREIAKIMKKFCYGFLGYDYAQSDGELEKIKKTGYSIEIDLNPQYFMYFDLMKIIPVQSENTNKKEFGAILYYEGDKFLAGFTMIYNSNQWQIESISSKTLNLENGELKKLTEKEYIKYNEV